MTSRFPLRVSPFAGFLASVFLVSCAPERTLSTDEDAALDPAKRAQGQAWVDSVMQSVLSRIEAVRGLEFTGTVRGTNIPRARYDSLMSALAGLYGGASANDPDWEMTERTMVILGMADSMGQWDAAQSSFDASTVQGFYLSQNKTLYVIDDGNEEDRVYTIVHEMVHALQDQNFGLDAGYAQSREADEDMAFTYATEGEAEYVTTAVLIGDTSALAMKQWVDAYSMTVDQLAAGLESWADQNGFPMTMILPQMAPYYLGPDLVSARRVRSGWSGVDSIYTDRLRTTRAAIHPFLSDSLRDWNPGACPAVSGAWRALQTGRLGALYLGSIVYGSLDPFQDLQTLAEEWRGDRFWTFHGDSGNALVWRTSWKDAASAKAFARSWWTRRATRRSAWGTTYYALVADTLKTASTIDSSRSAFVQVRGSEVAIAEGFSTVEARVLAAGLLDLPDRTVFAARGAGSSFGGGEWTPPRPPIPLPPPRIPGLPR